MAGLVLAVIVCPCAGAAGAAEEAPREVVTFWLHASGTVGLEFQKICETFNDVQSRYRLNPMMIPWNSNQKLLTSLAAGIPPDVMVVDRPAGPGYITRGALEDLTPYVEREGWSEEQFFRAPWRDGQYLGRTYVIPMRSDIRCLIYNRQMFRDAGLDPDRPPKTWDELLEYTRKLTLRDTNGRIRQLGFAADNNLVLVLGWQLGGDLSNSDLNKITIATEPYFQGTRFMKSLVDVSGVDDYLRVTNSAAPLDPQDPFFTGRLAMRLVEGFYLSRQKEYAPHLDTRLAPFPMPQEGEEPFSWISGFGLGIPKGARNPEGAWAFIRYMVSYEPQLAIGLKLGQLPVLREAAYHPEFYNDPNRKFLVDMSDTSKFYPKLPVIMEAYNETVNAVDAVLRGKQTPEKALGIAQSRVQESLDAYLWREGLPLVPWSTILWPIAIVCAGIAAGLLYAGKRYAARGAFSRQNLIAGYGFAMPWLLGLVVLTLGPMVASFIYSFCDYQVLKPARWAGLANYQRMISEDPLFWKSLWNTLYYTLFAVPLGLVLALAIAVLLNQPLRGMRVFRTIFYLPTLITGVAVSVLWLWVLQPEVGIVNRALDAIGIRGPLWMLSENWSKPSLIFMSLWGVGGSVLIFLAGLQGIPREMYEAAELDGAGPWRQFLNITLPLLSPTVFFVMIVGVIGSFQVFTQAFVMSNGTGAPLDSTLFYVLYLYRKGFEDFQMGYASAMAWLLFAVVMVLTLVQLRLSKRWVHY